MCISLRLQSGSTKLRSGLLVVGKGSNRGLQQPLSPFFNSTHVYAGRTETNEGKCALPLINLAFFGRVYHTRRSLFAPQMICKSVPLFTFFGLQNPLPPRNLIRIFDVNITVRTALTLRSIKLAQPPSYSIFQLEMELEKFDRKNTQDLVFLSRLSRCLKILHKGLIWLRQK